MKKKAKKKPAPKPTEIVRHAPRTLAPPIQATVSPGEAIENVLIKGDLVDLQPAERVDYYRRVCNSLGLNILTRPFDYILFKEPGSELKRLQLYANKSCTEQLRKIHHIGVKTPLRRDINQDLKLISVEADVYDHTGKTDTATGVVSIQKWNKEGRGLVDITGTELANAIMKAETKAKRRATLSISGLAVLDESELDNMHIVGGVTPEGRIFEYDKPRLPADTKPRELDENAEHGHERGSRKAEQASRQLHSVEEQDKILATSTDPEEIQKVTGLGFQQCEQIAKKNAAKGAKVQEDIPPAVKPPKIEERKPEPGQPVLEVETTSPEWFIVRGDIDGPLFPMVEHYCKFIEGWWRCDLEALKAMQKYEEKTKKFFIKILPAPAKSRSQEKRKAAQSKPAEPAVTVKGTVTAAIEGTAGTAPVRRVSVETVDGKKFTMSCFDKDLFPFLDKSHGQVAEFITKKNKQWTNIIGAIKIGATEFVDGKIPVVQRKDQPAGTLFDKNPNP